MTDKKLKKKIDELVEILKHIEPKNDMNYDLRLKKADETLVNLSNWLEIKRNKK